MSSYIPTSPTCSPENNCTDVKEIYYGLLNTGIQRAVSPFSYHQPAGTVAGSILAEKRCALPDGQERNIAKPNHLYYWLHHSAKVCSSNKQSDELIRLFAFPFSIIIPIYGSLHPTLQPYAVTCLILHLETTQPLKCRQQQAQKSTTARLCSSYFFTNSYIHYMHLSVHTMQCQFQ